MRRLSKCCRAKIRGGLCKECGQIIDGDKLFPARAKPQPRPRPLPDKPVELAGEEYHPTQLRQTFHGGGLSRYLMPPPPKQGF